MLLPSRSISCRLRPLQPSYARSLNTLPKPTAPYVKQWDPTKHSVSSHILDSPPTDPRYKLRRAEHAQRYESQDCRVFPSKQVIYDKDRNNFIRLNLLLRSAYAQNDSAAARKIRNIYRELRQNVPGIIHAITEKAWDLLWKIHTDVDDPYSENSRSLQRDVIKHGDYRPVGYRIRYIKNLLRRGYHGDALREWYEDYNGTNDLPRHDHKPEHLELGAKLHAYLGYPDRAYEIMQELFELHPLWDPGIMKIVFRAHTSSALTRHHNLANEIYKEMKERRGSDWALGDYDACFIGFLEARHLTYAKIVLRDMIKDGHLARSNSLKDIQGVLSRLHMLFRLGTDVAKMTSIALQAIKTLPPRYHSHVFTHWLRSAVIGNAPEAAGQIVDFMFRRNWQPQTIHFNLLLKALLRTEALHPEHNPYVLKAENIGWRMIEETRKSPAQKLPRRSAYTIISKWRYERKKLILDDQDLNELLSHVPKANSTTFAIIIQHHVTNQQWEHVDYLTRQVEEKGIRPTAALLNNAVNSKCQQGKFGEAWEIYKSFTDAPARTGVFPNGSIIRNLWKMLRLALEDETACNDMNLPRPRELLAETVEWWNLCRARSDADQYLMGIAANDHEAISGLMMHCFSYTNDLAGSLVGLHILREKFHILPSDKTVEIIQRHATWVDMRHEDTNQRANFYRRGIYKRNLANMVRVYSILVERRRQRMNMKEDDYAKLKNEEVQAMSLDSLSEFIRVALKRSYGPASTEAMILQAKEDAGVPDLPTGDLDAFHVV